MSATPNCNVKIPQMPKGVEHDRRNREIQAAQMVKIPQMPKGVEHKAVAMAYAGNFSGENTSDAERR